MCFRGARFESLPFTDCRNCGFSMCRSCCKAWPRGALPALYPKESDGRFCNVCSACDASAAAFRALLIAGDAEGARRLYDADAARPAGAQGSSNAEGISSSVAGGSNANINLRCPLPVENGQGSSSAIVASLMPVHLAAAADSLAALRWMCEEECCPLVGQGSLSLGKPPKSVLRVAIESQAVDVMQWLVAADDAPPHMQVPLAMPADSGCVTAAVHRALYAALVDGYRQRVLLNLTLEAAAAQGVQAQQEAPPPVQRQPSLPPPPPAEPAESDDECVVCLAAPRECVLIECGHACVCEQCSGALALCPICRAPIARVIRMYTS